MPLLGQRLTMVYVEPIGTGDSGRLPSHPHGYTRFPKVLTNRLGVPAVHLLGHSHGAAVTGPEHGVDADRRVREFAARHAGRAEVLAPFGAMSHTSDDTSTTAVARGVLPTHLADQRGEEQRDAPFRDAVRAWFISGLDEISPRTSSTTGSLSMALRCRRWWSWAGTT